MSDYNGDARSTYLGQMPSCYSHIPSRWITKKPKMTFGAPKMQKISWRPLGIGFPSQEGNGGNGGRCRETLKKGAPLHYTLCFALLLAPVTVLSV